MRQDVTALMDDCAYLQHAAPFGSRWRHRRSGGVYVVQGVCVLEANQKAAVLYRNTEGGPVWARNGREFLDGRFERVVQRFDTKEKQE